MRLSVIEGAFETEDCAKTIRLTVGSKGMSTAGSHRETERCEQASAAAAWAGTSRLLFGSRTCSVWSKADRKAGGGFLDSALCQVYRPIWWRCGCYTRLWQKTRC